MATNYKYQARPAESWQGRAEQKGGGFIGVLIDSVSSYQARPTGNWIRIGPPTWENPKHYGYDVWVHYGVGPQDATVLCNLKMYNEKCRVCEAYQIEDNLGHEDAAYDLKATRRVLIWLVDRQTAQNKADLMPQAWLMPWTLDRDISKLCRDPMSGELFQIDHPEGGYDLSFDREGVLPNVKYVGIQLSRRSSTLEDKYLQYMIERPLPSLLVRKSYEEVKNLFEGGAPPTSGTEQQQSEQQQQPEQQQQQPPPTNRPPWEQQATQTTVPQGPAGPFAPGQPQTPNVPAPPPPPPPPPPQEMMPVRQTIQAQYCAATVSFQGNTIACALPLGHPESQAHDFQRMMVPIAPQVQPQPAAPAPVASAAAVGGRAEALKARFAR